MIELNDYKEKSRVIVNAFQTIVKDYAELDFKDAIEDVNRQLAKYNPSIMFYGVYNAGKSSVINALSGENLARVGDIPTTEKVQPINWRGFTLVDTPGIVANDEHTRVADEEIQRNDIIVFLVDDMGTFENKEVSTAILKILKKEKPILVVINQKEGSEEDVYSSKIRQSVIPKIKSNIESLALKENYANPLGRKNSLGILAINAQTAITAYTNYEKSSQEYQLLFENSQMEHFISALEKELKNSQGIKLLRPAIGILKNISNQSIVILSEKLGGENEKEYYRTLERIEDKKSLLLKNIVICGKNEISQYEDRLKILLKNGNALDAVSRELEEKLNNIIKREFERSNQNLGDVIKDELLLKQSMWQSDAKIYQDNKIDLEMPSCEQIDGLEQSGITDNLSNLFSIPGSISTVIPGIPSLPLPVPVPGLVVIVPIIDELISMFGRKQKEERKKQELNAKASEYNEKIEAQVNENISKIYQLSNSIRTEMLKVEESFSEKAKKVVDESFEPLLKELREVFDMKKVEESAINESIRQIKKLREEIQEIEFLIEQ